MDLWSFLAGLCIYALTRFVELAAFPIYFFCDEAIQAIKASELVQLGWVGTDLLWLPPYFKNGAQWNLSASVWTQVPGLLFGRSIEITRASNGFISLLVPISLALLLKLGFKSRLWWLAALAATAIPAWFLHSRTGFETVITTSFFAAFLAAYALYRIRDQRYALLALPCAAMMFYGYANGQGLTAACAVLLGLIDLPHHLRLLKRPRLLLAIIGLVAILVTPYVRYRIAHPTALSDALTFINAYIASDLPLSAKLLRYAQTYATALDPRYLFATINTFGDFELYKHWNRHVWKDMGYVHWSYLPFALIGIARCIRHWREPLYRLPLIALIAVPFSPALGWIEITRVLALIVPIALLALLGLESTINLLTRLRLPVALLTGTATVALLSLTGVMSQQALSQAGGWYDDMGKDGLNYGAAQAFGATAARLRSEPDAIVIVSHAWAHNPEALRDFFVPQELLPRINLETVHDYMFTRRPLPQNAVFVMTPKEWELHNSLLIFTKTEPDQVIDAPNGEPAFYIARMTYGPIFIK